MQTTENAGELCVCGPMHGKRVSWCGSTNTIYSLEQGRKIAMYEKCSAYIRGVRRYVWRCTRDWR